MLGLDNSHERLEADVAELRQRLACAEAAKSRAEAALQQSEARFRTFLDYSPCVAFMKDADGRMVYGNAGMERLFPSKDKRFLGKYDHELFPREVAERLRTNDVKVLATRQLMETIELVPDAQGVLRSWLVMKFPVPDETGNVHLGGVAVDITEHRRVETELRQSEEMLRRILETVPGGIVTVGLDGSIRQANKEAQNLLGISWDQMSRRFVQDWEPETLREDGSRCPAADYPVSRCLATGLPQPPTTIGVRHRNGQIAWAVYTAVPITEPQTGEPAGAVVTFLDITERLRMEQAQRESEERMRLALNAGNMVTWGWNIAEDRLDDWSREYRELYGFAADDPATFGAWHARLHPDDRARLQERVRHILETPGDDEWREEFRILHPEPAGRWLFGLGRCFRDDAGRPLRIVGVNYDITERKQVEIRLRESEERFRQMADNIREVFWLVTADLSQLLYVSPAYEAIWGRSCASLYHQPASFLDAVHPDDRVRVEAAVTHREFDGRFEQEYRIVRPDGSVRWVWDRGFGIRDCNGKIYRVAGIAEDISDRKQAEIELHRQNAILQSVLDSMAEGVVVADQKGRIVVANRAAEQLAGVGNEPSDPNEWAKTYGLFLTDGVTPIAADQVPLTRTIRGEAVEAVDLYLNNKWVNVGRWLNVTGRPLRGPDGSHNGGVVVFRDVTERRLSEEKLKDHTLQLQALSHRLLHIQEEERRHLARELHDEVGQALTGLKLMFEREALLKPANSKEAYANAVKLIQDLMVRVRSLSMRLRPTLLDDFGLVTAIRWHARQYTEQTGVHVHLDVLGLHEGDRLPPELEIGSYRIVQETLTNVARHTQVSEVTVQIQRENETLMLEIRDKGPGFHPNDVWDSSGISGMRERASLLGGTLMVQSQPGAGTLVTARFPVSGDG
jgi:PAS domain S-box-containing protein